MWVKLSDEFEEHPKTYYLGAEGSAVQVWALSWCNRNRTRGFLPEPKVKELLERATRTSTLTPDILLHRMTTAAPREENPAWLRVDNGYRIHDYSGYQEKRYNPDSEVSTIGTITEPSLFDAQNGGEPAVTTPMSNRARARIIPDPVPGTRVPGPDTRDTSPNGDVSVGATPLREIFETCQQIMNGNGPRVLTASRRALLRARLQDGFTVEQLKAVPLGWSRMPSYKGRVYGSFETLYRNAANVEMFLKAASSDIVTAPVSPFKPDGPAARLAARVEATRSMVIAR